MTSGPKPREISHPFDCAVAIPGRHFSIDQGHRNRRVRFLQRRRNEICRARRKNLPDFFEMAFTESIGFRGKQDAIRAQQQIRREVDLRIAILDFDFEGIPSNCGQRS